MGMRINLKTAWLNNQIPRVQKGIFGDKLTNKNISVKKIKDVFVLVGNQKTGTLNDKDVVNYFLQFVGYPQYRKYIIETLHKLDNIRSVKWKLNR